MRHWTPRRRLALAAVLCMIGGLGSLVLYELQSRRDRDHVQELVVSAADQHVGLIQTRMTEIGQRLEGVARLISRSRDLRRGDFSALSEGVLDRYPDISALEWIPRVCDLNRAAYEEEARRDGYLEFRIHSVDSGRSGVGAVGGTDYFPI